MMIRAISLLSTALLLWGCTSVVEQPVATTTALEKAPTKTEKYTKHKRPYDAEIPRVTTRPSPVPKSYDKPIPRVATREYLNTQNPVPQGYGGYAYLVFTSDPASTQKERSLEICAVFNGYLPPTTSSSSAAERKSQMVTFWPLNKDLFGDEPNCHQLIANYDRVFASKIAASVGKQDARGPLLVAWIDPYGESSSEALVLDMSNFANDDLARAIRLWKGRISRDPDIWERGWKAEVVREEIRSIIENVLPGVVAVVGAWLPKPGK